MPQNITLSKGDYSVTIYSVSVSDNFQNKLFNITPPRSKQTQSEGPRTTRVIDLLRITRKFTIKGYLLSNEDKNNLIALIKGAGENGGDPITMTYTDGCDSAFGIISSSVEVFSVFIESATIVQKATDEPQNVPDNYAKYEVDISLIEGDKI